MMNEIVSQPGNPFPFGATVTTIDNVIGVNFALYSASARAVELCLFDDFGHEYRFPIINKTDNVFHIWIPAVPVGTKYGFRVYGDRNHNPQKLMLDPYAKAVVGKPDLSSEAHQSWYDLSDSRDNGAIAPKAVVINDKFSWGKDKPLHTPWGETVIYELHVKGFTQLRTDLPEDIRGTYAGLAHPAVISYLKDLGVTAVELLPVNFAISERHLQLRGLTNYWGYNPIAMFAVESEYASTKNPLKEFKSMVKALHKAGIEVILDVVFNHTAESDFDAPTFSYRGIDNDTYYWQDDHGNYLNWTGCGNLLNLSSDYTRKWVIDCLRYWVEECHVDGFRFDLATNLGRETPYFTNQARLFSEIMEVPSLAKAKLIAEPWDIGEGGYQVGNFPASFAEWNDRFRDDMVHFWLWQSGALGALAERISGSSDLFRKEGKRPHNTVNFITAHDGFTLHDLVSYNYKHNHANGEGNRDGRDKNYAHNHGIEGSADHLAPVDRDRVNHARFLSRKALFSSLILANGVPMILAGDEFGNTQFGNNNAYCQDNGVTWLKWGNFDTALFNAVKKLIAARKKIASLTKDEWWSDSNVTWLNQFGSPMNISDWREKGSKALQIVLDNEWLLLLNGKTDFQVFSLPEGKWTMEVNMAGNEADEIFSGQFAVDNLSFLLLKKQKDQY